MKGTILDFLKLAAEKPELARDLVDLAAKHGFQFGDEVSDDELDMVAGGAASSDLKDLLGPFTSSLDGLRALADSQLSQFDGSGNTTGDQTFSKGGSLPIGGEPSPSK